MHHQARGFVDDGEVLILEDESERHGAGLKHPRRLIFGNADRDRLTPGEQPGGPGRFPIDADELVGD
jgi:hypothetical protein